MAEEIDLERLNFTLHCVAPVGPAQKIYFSKDMVVGLIRDVFNRKGARRGSFKVDAFHRCNWWYDPPRDVVDQAKEQPPAKKTRKRKGE